MKQYAPDLLDRDALADVAPGAPLAGTLPYAEVAVQAPFTAARLATLTYAVPPFLRGRIAGGQLIWGNRSECGSKEQLVTGVERVATLGELARALGRPRA